jgi:putative endopeptidase
LEKQEKTIHFIADYPYMHRLLSRFRLKISPTLIRIDHKAGHGSNKATTKLVKEQADIYAFIMYNLGMKMKY